MKCFYDSTQDAVGLCKSCGKGLSAQYAVDLGKGLACKNQCEKDVRDLIALISTNIELSASSKKVMSDSEMIMSDSEKVLVKGDRALTLQAWFYVVIGIVFLITSIVIKGARFSAAFAVVFLLWGVLSFFSSKSGRRDKSNSQNHSV